MLRDAAREWLVGIFDRTRPRLHVLAVRELTLGMPEVEAADFFDLRV